LNQTTCRFGTAGPLLDMPLLDMGDVVKRSAGRS
jgi:hypothetical protein